MQELHESYKDNNELKEIFEKYQALESNALSDEFDRRRNKFLKKHQKRVEEGIESNITIRESRNIGRNSPCPCGSSKKFKKCCGSRLKVDDDRIY